MPAAHLIVVMIDTGAVCRNSEKIRKLETTDWWASDDEDYHSDESDDFFHYDDVFDAGDSSDDDVNVIDDAPDPSVCTRSKLQKLFNLLE